MITFFLFVDCQLISDRAVEKFFDKTDVHPLVNKTEEGAEDFGRVLRK